MVCTVSFVRIPLFEQAIDDGAVRHHIRRAVSSIIRHHVQQLESFLASALMTESLEKNVVGEDMRRAAKLCHSAEHYVHCVARPLLGTEALEQRSKDDGFHSISLLNNIAQSRETEVQTARAAAAADEDAIGVQGGSHRAVAGSCHAVEAGHGGRGAVARDGGEGAVQAADDRGAPAPAPALPEQFVEHVECVLGATPAGACCSGLWSGSRTLGARAAADGSCSGGDAACHACADGARSNLRVAPRRAAPEQLTDPREGNRRQGKGGAKQHAKNGVRILCCGGGGEPATATA
ncbi:hypothetical protein EE612_043096 [Oryza sativa]|nr:hypothetical protein EE612_043096 [Oryza sativa]